MTSLYVKMNYFRLLGILHSRDVKREKGAGAAHILKYEVTFCCLSLFILLDQKKYECIFISNN